MNGIMDLFMQDKFEDAKEVIKVGHTVQWRKITVLRVNTAIS
jgi:hypothetical protein